MTPAHFNGTPRLRPPQADPHARLLGSLGIRVVAELITPEIAASYLATSLGNRDIQEAWVAKLAAEIKSGEYTITHQGVAFDKDGHLVDGHHRLLAIIRAGVPAHMLVARGVPPESFRNIDNNRPRSHWDALKLDGRDGSLTHVAVARMMLCDFGGRGRRDPHRSELFAFYDKHHAAIDFAIQGPRDASSFCNAPVRAPIARAWYTADRERLRQFRDQLSTGMIAGEADSAIAILRNAFIASRASPRNREGRWIAYAKTESALKAFLDHRPLKLLREASAELFPIPE
jgi:hypothetical protein